MYAKFENKICEILDKIFLFQINKEFCTVVCEMKGKQEKLFLQTA